MILRIFLAMAVTGLSCLCLLLVLDGYLYQTCGLLLVVGAVGAFGAWLHADVESTNGTDFSW